ncbi:MAG: hypothetical protein AAB962_03785 [Patescibacteria group bacterium]
MSKFKQSFLVIAIGLALVAGISYAWTGPTANPPLNNAPAPINVSVLGQIKSGALQVNGFRNVGNSIFDGLAEFKSSIKIPTGAGTGKVLTSDAEGKAIWGVAGGGIGGSGTPNYVSKWKTNTELGNSQIFDSGTRVGIGTNNPQATLDLVGSIKIRDGTQGAEKVLTSDVAGNAGWYYPSISGYEIKTVTGYELLEAYCSGSKKVLGGGCRYDTGSSYLGLITSYPITGNTKGWACRTPFDDFPTTAYAICAN